jgi:hypothetical protein
MVSITSEAILPISTDSVQSIQHLKVASSSSNAQCYESWNSWINDAIRAGSSIGTITSKSYQTKPPSQDDYNTRLQLCSRYQTCGGMLRVEVASTKAVHIPYTKTISHRAKPSLSSLLSAPPMCSLSGDECFSAWSRLGAIEGGGEAKIWQIAEDLGTHMRGKGIDLFGCGFPPEMLDHCSNGVPGTSPLVGEDLPMPVEPHGECINHLLNAAKTQDTEKSLAVASRLDPGIQKSEC